jgi:hypothetical protein
LNSRNDFVLSPAWTANSAQPLPGVGTPPEIEAPDPEQAPLRRTDSVVGPTEASDGEFPGDHDAPGIPGTHNPVSSPGPWEIQGKPS